jgi:hypothetical protein
MEEASARSSISCKRKGGRGPSSSKKQWIWMREKRNREEGERREEKRRGDKGQRREERRGELVIQS